VQERRASGQLEAGVEWEVHPVYAIDVCKNTTLANCKDDNAAVWVPLHTWLAMLDDGN
jgi:hypothetical protein